ncbi:hypothetical protein NIIDNTM18_42800 [Mycolicibacterium litorale]|uniref:Uncharacterized protein n=1 Tax=Mycolicibacterium litorale TaxID=758802 RepID=A0A6S6PA61_9MYCO|nr:hypothetical protein [Mycolicibacterium litorale]BCI55002.1 hypothetical protein NIIDNTM18_42800 [Mycolicibacterium litorale]
MTTVQFACLMVAMTLLSGSIAFPAAVAVAAILDWWDDRHETMENT